MARPYCAWVATVLLKLSVRVTHPLDGTELMSHWAPRRKVPSGPGRVALVAVRPADIGPVSTTWIGSGMLLDRPQMFTICVVSVWLPTTLVVGRSFVTVALSDTPSWARITSSSCVPTKLPSRLHGKTAPASHSSAVFMMSVDSDTATFVPLVSVPAGRPLRMFGPILCSLKSP